ncbi:MAG: FAD-dependent oxidoreductase, partial [Firmicutes bacterium]|nr:FAD-dependent oxidoreductase [Bacillota bacterium]
LERIFTGRPVAIRDVQLAVAEHARRRGLVGLRLPAVASGHDVAVVGGGPAGIACAIKLLEAGHTVTLYEKEDRLGGIPDNLIPATRFGDSRAEVEAILSPALAAGRLRLKLGCALGREVSLGELRKKHAAVFLAVGLGAAISSGQGEGVVDALRFLRRVKRGELSSLEGLTVAVVGGGNTAVDAAVTAKRLGAADVYLVYRRSYLEMPAWEEERRMLLAGGVHPLFLLQPVGYEFEAGRLVGLRLARVRLGPADSTGRRRPEVVPERESVLQVDLVIEALGQEISPEVKAALGELVSPNGDRVVTLPGSRATAIPGVFAGGDLVNGGQTVVRAVAEGMRAAEEIEDYLRRGSPV